MTQAQEPIFRIFKTLELANTYAARLNKARGKHVPMCVRPKAYLVVPEGFSAIKSGFGYPAFWSSFPRETR